MAKACQHSIIIHDSCERGCTVKGASRRRRDCIQLVHKDLIDIAVGSANDKLAVLINTAESPASISMLYKAPRAQSCLSLSLTGTLCMERHGHGHTILTT